MEKNPKEYEKNDITDPFDYNYLKVSSAQDCTGLIPTAAKEDDIIENYVALYPFLPNPPTELK